MLLEGHASSTLRAPWTTVLAQLQRAFEVPQFHAEARERREGVDDEPTAIAGVAIVLVGIRLHLDRAVDADRVGDPLIFPRCGPRQSRCWAERRRMHTL